MTIAVTPRHTTGLTHLQGSLLVLATGVVFSFGGLAYRSAEAAGPWQYSVFRGLGAFVVAVTYLAFRHRRALPALVRTIAPTHVLAGVLIGSISCLFIASLEVASVAFVMFLQTASPIAAAYFSWLLIRERVSRNVMVATGITLVGTGIMVSGTLTDRVAPAGLIAVAIPLVFGLYTTLIRAAPAIDPTVPVVFSGTTMMVVGLVVTFASAGSLDIAGADAATAFFAGAVLLGVPLILFNVAQRAVPSSESTLLLMNEVVLAPLWVWVFVAEQPEWTTLLGGSIILSAIAWLTVARAPRRVRVVTTRG